MLVVLIELLIANVQLAQSRLEFSDKACHKVFESLFRFVGLERSIYTRAQRSNSKTPSSTRLSTCALVVRTAVDIFSKNLRTKTVRAIVDHIIDTIQIPGEGLWEPLSVDYTKCLASLLRYPPHAEHLGDEDWDKLMDFCLTVINLQERSGSQLSIRSGHRVGLEEGLDDSDGRATPSRATPAPAGAREKHLSDRNVIGEVVACIQLLTAIPNAPVQAAAENALQGLVEFVKSPTIMGGNSHQLAFSSINTVASKVLFDQFELVRSSLLDLIPVIRRLWTTKFSSLKDELLVTLMLSTVVLADTTSSKCSDSSIRSIEGLAESLHSEYVKRSEKDLLQIDEAVFAQPTLDNDWPTYGPRIGNARSEHNWTVLWVIAALLKFLQKATIQEPSSEQGDELPRKRQRINSMVDDVLRDSLSATGTRRICALQLIPFLESTIELGGKEALTRRLVPNILDDNPAIASWTMTALSRYARRIYSLP